MNENDKIDQAAQDQLAHETMVESVIDREPILRPPLRQVFIDDPHGDPAAEAAFQRIDAAARKRKEPKLIQDALNGLIHYVNDSIDYPDAEDRIANDFRLTEAQVKEVRALYDAENDG